MMVIVMHKKLKSILEMTNSHFFFLLYNRLCKLFTAADQVYIITYNNIPREQMFSFVKFLFSVNFSLYNSAGAPRPFVKFLLIPGQLANSWPSSWLLNSWLEQLAKPRGRFYVKSRTAGRWLACKFT